MKKPAPLSIIYGKHSCFEALKNPRRKIFSVNLLNDEIFKNVKKIVDSRVDGHQIKINKINNDQFESLLKSKIFSGRGMSKGGKNYNEKINHQGIFLEVNRLEETNLFEFLEKTAEKEFFKIVILDHVLDPLNIGSIIRICAAFETDLLILTKDNCPDYQNPVIVKIASGAIEFLDISVVVNLASTIDILKKNGYWVYGFSLDHQNKKSIYEVEFSKRSVLVLGGEEKGLRKLTNQKIDLAVYIPISSRVESLNVSSALSVGLFELNRKFLRF